MASIQSSLLHWNLYATVKEKKFSADRRNTSYTIGYDGQEVHVGVPEIAWDKVVFIKDRHVIWTHGQLYAAAVIEMMSAAEYAAIEVKDLTTLYIVQYADHISLYYADHQLDTVGKDGKDGRDGRDGRDGIDGVSMTQLGDWLAGMTVPYLGVVRMGGALYQCINLAGSKDAPVQVYLDQDGNPVLDHDKQYLLSGEASTDFVKFAEDGRRGNPSLTLGLNTYTVHIPVRKEGIRFVSLDTIKTYISVVALYDSEEIIPRVVSPSSKEGTIFVGSMDVTVTIPKGTAFRRSDILYRCTLEFTTPDGILHTQECKVRAIPDTSLASLYERLEIIEKQLENERH